MKLSYCFVFFTDEKFLRGVRVAVHSCRKFHPCTPIYIYTNSREVRDDEVLNRYDCHFVDIPDSDVWGENHNDRQRFPEIVSQRISVFRQSLGCEYLIYNDVDVLFTRNIEPMIKLAEKHRGKMLSVMSRPSAQKKERFRELDMSLETDILLHGCHYIIPASICCEETYQAMLHEMRKYDNRWDERAISTVLHDRAVSLPPGFLLCNNEKTRPKNFCIHYTGKSKPWDEPAEKYPRWHAAEQEILRNPTLEGLFIEIDPNLTPVWQLWIGSENLAEIVCEKTVETVYNRQRGYQYIKLHWADLPRHLKVLGGRVKAQTADVVRFWLLATYGGVWVDSDIIARKEIPFRQWLRESPDVIPTINHSVNRQQWASNGYTACNVGNPVMKQVYEQSLRVYSEKRHIQWNEAGPQVLTTKLLENPDCWKPLPWEEWAHAWTNSGVQGRYRRVFPPGKIPGLTPEAGWYYAHVVGVCLRQHAGRKSFADGNTAFCEILKFVYQELNLELP